MRQATLADVQAITALEFEHAHIRRDNDFRYFIENREGIWHASVIESSAGKIDGFLVSIAHAASNMLGPGLAKNPDDAIAYLQTNLEYYPKSARTYQAMAQARNAKGDKQAAIKDLEKAVELDPQNAQARNQLQQLKGQ